MNDVRATPVPPEFGGQSGTEQGGAIGALASPAQLKFIRDLAAERDIPEEARIELLARVDSGEITKSRASDFIQRLKDKPLKAGAVERKIRVLYEEMTLDDGKQHRVGRVEVPNVGRVIRGHYALDTSADDTFTNNVTFFQVWVGSRGGWKVFMEVSDDSVELVSWGTKRSVIERIASDPFTAAALWGHDHSRCGVCGRRLTNDVSRDLGIGPVCRTRL